MHASLALLLALAAAGAASPACAARLPVGPGRAFAQPSAAAAAAADGDTIAIDPGRYTDCATWTADRLTIEATGQGVELTGPDCTGGGVFVVRGADTTLRGLTFARGPVASANAPGGAGVLVSGRNLRVIDSRFADSRAGLVAEDHVASEIRIEGCDFAGNAAAGADSHDVVAGRVDLLRIEHSRFGGAGGAPILTRAARTELVGNQIADAADGYLVAMPDGGDLVMDANTLELDGSAPRPAAVLVAEDDGHAVEALALHGNTLVNRTGHPVALLHDWGSATPVLAANVLGDGDTEVTSSGIVLHRLRAGLLGVWLGLRGLAGSVVRTGMRLVAE